MPLYPPLRIVVLEKKVHHVASEHYPDKAASVVYDGHGVMLLHRLEQLLHRRIVIEWTRVRTVDYVADKYPFRILHIHTLNREEILEDVIVPEHTDVFAV